MKFITIISLILHGVTFSFAEPPPIKRALCTKALHHISNGSQFVHESLATIELVNQIRIWGRQLAYFPLNIAIKLPGFLKRETAWALRVGVVGTMVGSSLSIFTDPLSNRITNFVNDKFGAVGIKLQMALSDTQRAIELRRKMSGIRDELENIQMKYLMKNISEDEAVKLWTRLEQTFLNYRNEFMATLPTQQLEGRSLMNEGNINYPLQFATALSAAHSEKLLLEDSIENLKAKKLAFPESNEAIENEIQRKKRLLLNTRQKLGTMAGMWRVWEILYPEINRPEFKTSEGHSEEPLYSIYDSVMEGLHLEDYANDYLTEMNRFLRRLEIPGLEGVESK